MNLQVFEASIVDLFGPPGELLDSNYFLRSQGINPENVNVERYFQKMPHFAETKEEAETLIRPQAILNFLPVQQIRGEKILLQGGEAIESRLMASLLNSAAEIVVAVTTIGEDLEKRVDDYFKEEDSSKALSLDSWGTSALVSFGRKVQQHLKTMAEKKGVSLSISFSPGHSEWPLRQQGVLFRLLPAEKIGVRLTDSFLMIPKKSTSMIAGLGNGLVCKGSKCDYCPRQKECLFCQS